MDQADIDPSDRDQRQQSLLELILHYTLPGAASGYALYELSTQFDALSANHFLIAQFIALLVLSTTYWLMTEAGGRLASLICAVALACTLSILGAWTWKRFHTDWVSYDQPSFPPMLLLFLCCLLTLFLSLPFVRRIEKQSSRKPNLEKSGQTDKGWYTALFDFSFNHFAIVILGFFFGSAALLLVVLLVAMFNVIGIDLESFLLQPEVLTPVFVAGVATALGVGRSYEELVIGLRTLILALLRLLLPFHLLIVFSFLIAAAVMGLEKLDTDIGVTALLLIAIAIALTLSSATVGGTRNAVENRASRIACRLLAFSVLPLAAIAAYALWLRIDQHGLTPERIFALVTVGLGVLYGCLYAFSSLTPSFESSLQKTNIALAIVSIVIFTLMLTPLLDIYRLSAMQQLSRFEKQKVNTKALDLGLLKFRLGSEGRKALNTIASSEAAKTEPLVTRLASLEEYDDWWEYNSINHLSDNARESEAFDKVLTSGQLILVVASADEHYKIENLEHFVELESTGAIKPYWEIEKLLGVVKQDYFDERDCISGTIKCALMVTDKPIIAAFPVMALLVKAESSGYENFKWFRKGPENGTSDNRYERSWRLLAPDFYSDEPRPARLNQAAAALIEQIADGKLPMRKVEVNALDLGYRTLIPGTIPELSRPIQ